MENEVWQSVDAEATDGVCTAPARGMAAGRSDARVSSHRKGQLDSERLATSLHKGEETMSEPTSISALSPLLPKAWLLPEIDRTERTAAMYRAQGKLDDWAREQYNLGNAWCAVPEVQSPAKWEKAIAHYQQALVIRTRQKDPERYAATMQNLGTAYRELKSGNRMANICHAIHCFHLALRALPRAAGMKQRADLHNNLGNAYASLAAEDHKLVRNAVRALRHFGRALDVRTKEAWPCDYAVTQFNAGNVCLQLAHGCVAIESSLLKGRHCFEEARDGFVACRQAALADVARRRLDLIAELLENRTTNRSHDSPGFHERRSEQTAPEPR
jgi:tetratricopeptide (TPR) repeat protein